MRRPGTRGSYETNKATNFSQVNLSTPMETPINNVKKPLIEDIMVKEETFVYWRAPLLQ